MNEFNCDNFVVSTMKWSFSRLNSYYSGCPYEFERHYIECEPAKQGFYGAAGGFAHETIEQYAKGQLDMWDLPGYFEDNFAKKVPYDAPPNKYKDLKQDWYDSVLDYFNNIDLPIDKYEIVGVEKQVDFEIEGYPFIGFIDLLLRDPEDGKLILCDHKTTVLKRLKSGAISKTDQEHFLAFKRQQYLYSQAVMEEYGDNSIKELWWNMIRQRDFIKIPFSKNEYEEAKTWALDTIHRIENETEWLPNPNMWYCNYLCSIGECPYRV